MEAVETVLGARGAGEMKLGAAARDTGASGTWPEALGAERIEPGTAAMAAGAAGAGLTAAEAAESRLRALGAEEMKPRAAEVAEL